jgi:hypothetical protein
MELSHNQAQTGLIYVVDPPFAGNFHPHPYPWLRTVILSARLKVIISLLRLSPTQIEASIYGCCTTSIFFNCRNIKYSVTNIS